MIWSIVTHYCNSFGHSVLVLRHVVSTVVSEESLKCSFAQERTSHI